MYLVALANLATPAEQEAPLLAADLGIAVYDARRLLSGERPKIILRTADEHRARALLATLRGRAHRAIAFAASAIVPIGAMIAVSDFHFDPDAMSAGHGRELPYADISSILRAIRTQHASATKVVKERKFAPGAAIASGGLILTKKTSREVTTRSETREHVIYLMRKSGAPPWVVSEHRSSFEGLAERMALSVTENLGRFVDAVRERAVDALYDDSLMRFRAGTDGVGEGERQGEQVHALALTLARLGSSTSW